MKPLDYYDTALLYGASGGTPQYFLQYDRNISAKENITDKILDTSSCLFEEPENLLKQEVREATLYNSVITAVAGVALNLQRSRQRYLWKHQHVQTV